MKFWKSLTYLSLLSVFVLSACSGSTPTEEPAMEQAPTATEAMMDKPTEAAMMDKPTDEAMMDKPTDEVMMDKPTDEAMMEMPAWFSIPLTDVRSGDSYTIADFKGKVILVENMAVWCSNCLKQQNQVLELHQLLGENDDLVSLGLGIDPNEDAQKLRGYIDSKGFDWMYSVAPAELSREISNLYGAQFLNPPSAPMLIIDRHGNVHPLPFGIKSAAELQKALEPFMNEEM